MKDAKWNKIYHSWRCLIDRCRNETHKQFKNYGGRGIRVCERWLESGKIKTSSRPTPEGFKNFFDDMESTWFPGATIDRIDNDGDYTPENCQWLTRSDNSKKCPYIHTISGENNPMKRKDVAEKVSRSMRGNNHPQYGSIWISNGIESKKLKEGLSIPDGWHRGRK